jgi:DNA polymerase/3'-5' exonuclease PolX
VSRRRELGIQMWQFANLTRVDESGRSFRSKAYRRAVWSLDDLEPNLDVDSEALLATPGIGLGIARLINEFRETGSIEQLERLQSSYPVHAHKMSSLPRMKPALLRRLKRDLGIETWSDLAASVDTGAVLTVPGVGEATLSLWRAIVDMPPSPRATPSHAAWIASSQLSKHLAHHLDADVWVTGSVRRVEEWVEQLDIVLAITPGQPFQDFLATTAALKDAEPAADDTGPACNSGRHQGRVVPDPTRYGRKRTHRDDRATETRRGGLRRGPRCPPFGDTCL